MEVLPYSWKVYRANAERFTIPQSGREMGVGSRATRSILESRLAEGRDERLSETSHSSDVINRSLAFSFSTVDLWMKHEVYKTRVMERKLRKGSRALKEYCLEDLCTAEASQRPYQEKKELEVASNKVFYTHRQ